VHDQEYLCKKPENLSIEEAASFPLVAITVYQSLKRLNLNQGDKILIVGAAGGTGNLS
jgi:NADPH:quinone reductase-like Zn-dependent oxidoreductase